MPSSDSGRDYARDRIVKREIIPSTAFNRLARRLAKRQPGVAASIHATLQQLNAGLLRPSYPK
jgi:hypothetical protein